MIKIKGLTFFYGDAREPALKNINLTVGDGEFILIAGPSGGGKSSLARCLNGLVPHFYGGRLKGRIEVEGLETIRHAPKELATRVGMVFQDPENQLVTTDVEREIAFGLENLALPRPEIAKRIEEALDTVGVAGLRCRSLHELSGGEKQKVAIASVLALKPRVLVLDEPTSELDPQGAEEVLSILQRLNDELGLTVILVEHRLERVIHLVDRLVVLSAGEIIADGRPQEVLEARYEELVRAGVGVPPLIVLIQKLKERGVPIERIPLTVKEGRAVLESVFREGIVHPHPDSLPSREREEKHTEEQAEPAIEIENLWHAYQQDQPVLKGISLRISRGEFIAVMGRNAAGKSTLIKHFNGLLKPLQGRVRVFGRDTRGATVAEMARHVGYVFQNPNDHLFADTVAEEIAFTLKLTGCGDIPRRVEETLARFNLARYKDQYPHFLSGGEKQRLALASVLVAQPPVLVLDEPTRGMDHRLKNELMQFLDDYRKGGNIVILVTHDVETAVACAERVILLSEGKVVVDGNKKEVLSRALLFSPQINRVLQGFAGYGVPQDILTAEEALELVWGG
ncbi:MAG: ATP-binding cassette domain-containing protein [Deltaproteobacteria bacterium]|nr:MAG: ATP-binding cassette domain-containing protein [Deltaproteobacteria bacterium]